MPAPRLEKIVSGGQTGVDRAALDVALRLGVPCGGWCPRGRRAEDGLIPLRYPLEETHTDDYAERTRLNVRDSDGTLILCIGEPQGGTAYTIACCGMEGRPCHVVDLNTCPSVEPVIAWTWQYAIRMLNVAGPRESSSPGIYELACGFLQSLLGAACNDN